MRGEGFRQEELQMLRRLVTVIALASFALATPALAASKAAKKPAAKSTKSTKSTAKKPAATPAATPVAEVVATPAPAKKSASKDRAFIRTTRAGWQEVIVGDKVIATRDDGSKVSGTIREVSDYSIVIEPKKTEKVTIASNDLAQVFHDAR
jgi:hypothetical protein